jgi:hypothetical protein
MADTSHPEYSTQSPPGNEFPIKEIGNTDGLSRHLFMRVPRDRIDEYIDVPFFEFPKDDDPELNRAESVVWRLVAVSDAEVHELGLSKQRDDIAKGKNKKYVGFRSSTAGIVQKKVTSRGHGFEVVHYPKEGSWHAHVQVRPAEDTSYTSSDKRDIQALIEEAFSEKTPFDQES